MTDREIRSLTRRDRLITRRIGPLLQRERSNFREDMRQMGNRPIPEYVYPAPTPAAPIIDLISDEDTTVPVAAPAPAPPAPIIDLISDKDTTVPVAAPAPAPAPAPASSSDDWEILYDKFFADELAAPTHTGSEGMLDEESSIIGMLPAPAPAPAPASPKKAKTQKKESSKGENRISGWFYL